MMNSRGAFPTGLVLRLASAADADAIAALHVASWRATYRGMLKNAYLDGDITEERRSVWAERLGDTSRERPIVVTAFQAETLVGFSCLMPRFHPTFGALLDNLHINPAHQRNGIGKRLFAAAIENMTPEDRKAPLHLLVFARNEVACQIYDRLGGVPAERRREPEPDGSLVEVVRYQWPNAGSLRARLVRTEASRIA